ncbi:hypothetical protein ACWKWU_17940 [Chitinophaga lutea]
MSGISPWMAAVRQRLLDPDLPFVYEQRRGAYRFTVHLLDDACWIVISSKKGRHLGFRAAYAPHDRLLPGVLSAGEKRAELRLQGITGEYSVEIDFPDPAMPLFRCRTRLIPAMDISITCWPRDLVPLGSGKLPDGELHVSQMGLRSGLLYFSCYGKECSSLLYFQNLTSLAGYNIDTQTSAGHTVSGTWPEVGFSLPPSGDRVIKRGKEYTLSDAFLLPDTHTPKNPLDKAEQFMTLLAQVYCHVPRPATQYVHWPEVLQAALRDLTTRPGCWQQAGGQAYLNAYVCDYKTPAEAMVQLAVLLPLMDYAEWSGEKLPVIEALRKGLPAFYDEKAKTVGRWLPIQHALLDGSEEHKKAHVIDAWYLHHPLLNLGRMALKGDDEAKRLFLNSMDFVIRVARHFKYQWPVFYDIYTLDVIKPETAPGMGGEQDVAGVYAHVMLKAYALTNDQKYLQEAKKAAGTLEEKGFALFYQANNTAFAAGAMLQLYKLTGQRRYLRLSYLCLANICKNFWLWDCNYGNGEHFSSFFALFPLNDAPYTAVYEEQEGFAAFHDYLSESNGIPLLPAVSVLLPEFIRYMLHRAAYYYPPKVPPDMLSPESKSGELDRGMYIPVEDLQDGWQKSGQIGQEVYGAGLPFTLVPRHYHVLAEAGCAIFIDYPTSGLLFRRTARTVYLQVLGDQRFHCRLIVMPLEDKRLPDFSLKAGTVQIEGKINRQGYPEFIVPAGQKIALSWSAKHSPKKQKHGTKRSTHAG